ncbi:AAA family ATPase [Mycobacteroides abscessus]|uniref:AAA family ATPase n=1 Tax=Mycobacteroides abscessus TaxID=36809 RepID=UPI00232C5E1E|nr:AAA family ATPase [Mycobacteroides abscessus]MDB2199827.1 AAA family ATPase [Mycobacteroides abscessus subsp. abscessus]
MGEHVPPLRLRDRNLTFSADGSVWCNYLLTGINVNSYQPDTATAAQDSHELLYAALSQIPTDDIMITGFKYRKNPLDTMNAITGGIPDWDPVRYRYLGSLLDDLYRRMCSGKEFVEFDRLYWIAISQPTSRRMTERLVSTVVDVDPLEGMDWADLEEFEKHCFNSLPIEFRPRRATPEFVDWAFERATTRGLSIPMLPPLVDPDDPNTPRFKPTEKAYPEVMFDEAAEATALYSTYLTDLENGRKYTQNLSKVDRKRSLFKRFRTLAGGKIMSISHPSKRTASLPDGPVSYQSLFGIARYPARFDEAVSKFTYIVDQAIDADADFTLRVRFSQDLVETRSVSNTEKDLVSEGTANASDEFEAHEYDTKRAELRRFHTAIRDESGPIGMQMAAIFAFGSDDLDHLQSRVSALQMKFRKNGYTPLLPVGGQKDLWTMMMPGSRRTRLGDDLLQTSTAHWFSGAMPLRRSFAGDPVGMPIAINKENALGQIILLDILNATNQGNASMAFTGAQGRGKSHALKLIFLFVTALNRYASVVDHSPHGEWAVFALQVARTQVVNAATGFTYAGYRSMDPLKCLPSPEAEIVMQAHYLPLFEIDSKTSEAAYFAKILNADFRKVRGITSTRRLMEWLATAGEPEARLLLFNFEHWAALPYSRAFIDPPRRNHDDDGYPPFDNIAELAQRMEDGTTPHATVFRTNGLPVYRGKNPKGATDQNKWAAAVYGSIARMTAFRFSQIRGTCVFFADEISFLKGNEDVVELLIRSPDRIGRKDGNFLAAGSQHADDYDENYAMIEKKGALGQKTRENAIAALSHIDMPVLDSLIDMIINQTSPPDPDNPKIVRAGRHGEGWWNDGTITVRCQYFPILSAVLARFADTTTSRMIRESDLDEHGSLRSAAAGRHAANAEAA